MARNIEIKEPYLADLVERVCYNLIYKNGGHELTRCTLTLKNGSKVFGYSGRPLSLSDRWETEEDLYKRACKLALEDAVKNLKTDYLTTLNGTNNMTQFFLSEDKMRNEIADVRYLNVEDTTLSICVIILKNGYTVTGESSCIDPAKFNAEIGKKIAYENAFNKLWGILGYVEKQRWFTETQTKQE